MLKTYYELTKPGLVWGNLITTLAGFLFASRFSPSPSLLLFTLAGTALIIASACVFNNVFDREADKKMARTKGRALASGAISVSDATVFGSGLSFLGFALLFFMAGLLSGLVALFAFVVYVRVYTRLKYYSLWAVFVGALAGASPIAIGYTAVSNNLDLIVSILFATMVLWQMPHFYSIALYRRADYLEAGIPVLSITKGNRTTYRHIMVYIFLYLIAAASLYLFGEVGITYLIVVLVMGIVWLGSAFAGSRHPEDLRAARRMFFVSIAVMVSFAITLAFAPILP